MKNLYVLVLIIFFTVSFNQIAHSSEKKPFTITKEVLKDKIMGGWAGKTIACTFGGPTEFRFQGTMIQDYQPIHWDDHYMKWWYDNSPGLYDDIYMDLTFVDVYDKLGIDAPVDSSASAFAHAGYMLWHDIGRVIIKQSTINKQSIIDFDRGEQGGNRHTSPHCIRQISTIQ